VTTILPENKSFENERKILITRFLKDHHIGKMLNQCNFRKTKGIPCLHLLEFLILLVFSGKNLYRILAAKNRDSFEFHKDCVYRFLNDCHYNWRKFLLMIGSSVIRNYLAPLTSEKRVNVFIVDDSLYSRSRSKAVELLARVKDHVANKYVKGFRMLTLGWSDGNTFLPLAFTLLSSADESNRLCGVASHIDKRTNGYARRKEAQFKSTDALINLLKQAQSYMIPASYLLFDSWFAFPSVICKIRELKIHTICMLKALPKIYYGYGDKRLNLKSLYAAVKKKRGRAKTLASVIVTIGYKEDGTPIQAKILFVRDKNRSREWLALLSTDIELQDEEIVRIYGKRWDIEIFFKMAKSHLRLAKEFQGRSYDSMVAHTTIVFIRYIILALESRCGQDQRTIGELFFACCDELKDLSLIEALQRVFTLLQSSLQACFQATEAEIRKLLAFLIDALPKCFKEKLAFCS
jgi:hypothetical protein